MKLKLKIKTKTKDSLLKEFNSLYSQAVNYLQVGITQTLERDIALSNLQELKKNVEDAVTLNYGQNCTIAANKKISSALNIFVETQISFKESEIKMTVRRGWSDDIIELIFHNA